jgi:hypothetical protein|tara:strand:- start:553 stop:765 length:213 start_codon:yes stop_codon:yes gene_type:complete
MAETVDELKQDIVDRFAALSDDDKDTLVSMIGTQEFRVLGKVLGPELSGIANFSAMEPAVKPKKRGLATR